MNRELALKIVLAVVGLLFIALGYPWWCLSDKTLRFLCSSALYVTLGIFLPLAIRDPSASRSVIAFTAWSSFAHAALMGTQACRNMVARGELIGVAVLVIIGAVLIALAHRSSFWSHRHNRANSIHIDEKSASWTLVGYTATCQRHSRSDRVNE